MSFPKAVLPAQTRFIQVEECSLEPEKKKKMVSSTRILFMNYVSALLQKHYYVSANFRGKISGVLQKNSSEELGFESISHQKLMILIL